VLHAPMVGSYCSFATQHVEASHIQEPLLMLDPPPLLLFCVCSMYDPLGGRQRRVSCSCLPTPTWMRLERAGLRQRQRRHLVRHCRAHSVRGPVDE
jgi:hypothetical protein